MLFVGSEETLVGKTRLAEVVATLLASERPLASVECDVAIVALVGLEPQNSNGKRDHRHIPSQSKYSSTAARGR